MKTENLEDKILTSKGCHNCIFEQSKRLKYWHCLIKPSLYVADFGRSETRHPNCPLLTFNIKVVVDEN